MNAVDRFHRKKESDVCQMSRCRKLIAYVVVDEIAKIESERKLNDM